MQFGIYQNRRKQVWLPAGAALLLMLGYSSGATAQDEPVEGEEPAEEGAPSAEEGGEAKEGGEAGIIIDGSETEPGSADDGDSEVEEIVITGSRIGRSNLDSYANIAVVTSEDLKLSGVSNVEEFLRQMPSLTLQGLGKQNNNYGAGLSQVDLRNLGTGRTLVLINGKRIIGAYGGGVDLNNVPVQMVDRIEVLLDGASAVYGSDAVAGVVNIVLKDDFEGYRVDVGGGITTKGDGETFTADVTAGGNFDRGNMALNLSYSRRMEIEERDRSFAHPPSTDSYYEDMDGDGVIDPEDNQVLWGSIFTPGGIAYSSLGGNTFGPNGEVLGYSYFDHVTMGPDPNGQTVAEYLGWTDESPYVRYNWSEAQFLQGRTERIGLTAIGSYELGQYVEAYMQGDFTHRTSLNRLAPQPISGPNTYLEDALYIPLTNPYIPDDYSAMLYSNDYIEMYRRGFEFGQRKYVSNMETFRVVAGLEGEFLERSSWDIFANYSKMFSSEVMHNSINMKNLVTALDPQACANDPACPGVINLFGEGSISDDHVRYIGYNEQTQSMWDMLQTGLSLKGGLFKLPGGYLTAVIGGDFRWERGYTQPDARVSSGESAENFAQYTGGDYNVQEAFGEISIPILKGLPGVEELTIDLAGRLSNYNTSGSQFTYRGGLAYAPLRDIKFRGVYSTAFRAPPITALYSGVQDGYPVVNDPCSDFDPDTTTGQNCQAEGVPEGWSQTKDQIKARYGSNPDLDAEESTQINGGIVITPTFISEAAGSLTLTGDFYRITVDSAISSLDPQTIVDKCYASENMSHSYCQYISGRTSNHDIGIVSATLLNAQELITQGIDFTVLYGVPIWRNFRADLTFNGNFLLKYDIKTEGETEHRLGTIANLASYDGAFAHFRFLTDLTLGTSMIKVSNRVRFVGPVDYFGWEGSDEEAGTWDDRPIHAVDGIAYWDLSAMLVWQAFDLVIGMDNVLDTDPPFIPSGDGNSNPNSYDFVGRYIYAKLGYQF
jgi:iron complex outermembrane receptor protein